MANAFEEIRQRIDKKEREVMSTADQFCENNIREIENYQRLINGRSLSLQQTTH